MRLHAALFGSMRLHAAPVVFAYTQIAMISFIECIARYNHLKWQMWQIALRCANIGPDVDKLQYRVVCSDHFSDDAYMCPGEWHMTSQLKWNAVPTVFSHGNAPKQLPKRRAPRLHLPLPPRKITGGNASEFECGPAVDASAEVPVLLRASRKVQMVPKSCLSGLRQCLMKKNDEVKLLKQKLRNVECKLRQTIRKAEHLSLDKFKLKPEQHVFLNLQPRSTGLEKVREYSSAEKEYAIALYHYI